MIQLTDTPYSNKNKKSFLNLNTSKYKPCPKCGLSNNPIESISGDALKCRVCGFTCSIRIYIGHK